MHDLREFRPTASWCFRGVWSPSLSSSFFRLFCGRRWLGVDWLYFFDPDAVVIWCRPMSFGLLWFLPFRYENAHKRDFSNFLSLYAFLLEVYYQGDYGLFSCFVALWNSYDTCKLGTNQPKELKGVIGARGWCGVGRVVVRYRSLTLTYIREKIWKKSWCNPFFDTMNHFLRNLTFWSKNHTKWAI